MTLQERIEKAKANIDFKFNTALYWANLEGADSEQAMLWTARWVAAKEVYEMITGEKLV